MTKDDKIVLNDRRHTYLGGYNEIINTELTEHFLRHADCRRLRHEEAEINQNIIRERVRNIQSLCFEITQDCNLACKYCVYNGSYQLYKRAGKKTLSIQTARQTLDYIHGLIKDRAKPEFAISFYGGEPLLFFGLIQKIVDYSSSLFKGWKILYTLTTNGTLLDSDMIDFFATHHFVLTVSLDGPRENHDSKRILKNGKGTHRMVIENLKKIKQYNSDFFSENITFYSVFSKDLDLSNSFRYFSRDSFIRSNPMRMTYVDESGGNYYDDYPYDKERVSTDYSEFMKEVKIKAQKKEKLTPIETFAVQRIASMEKRLTTTSITAMGSSCFYDNKLFIDASGKFHICEKMNNHFPIGSAETGFNFPRMVEIAGEFSSELKKKCFACSVRAICERCFVFLAKEGFFKLDEEFCDNRKKSIISNLETFIQFKEKGII